MKHLMTPCHARGMSETLSRKVAKQVANQNCFWPITQLMADKLLVASKRLIRYIALYSMAGVAMETKLFRIHPNTRDTPFMEACAAFLTPKMDLRPSDAQWLSVFAESRSHLQMYQHYLIDLARLISRRRS